MRRLSAFTTTVLLAFGLGCSGAVNGLGKLAGVDLEVQMGPSAVHPVDFPAGAPATGERAMSMRLTAEAASLDLPPGLSPELTASHYRMEMVAYTVDPASVDGLLDAAVAHVRAAGWVERSVEASEELDRAAIFDRGGVMFMVATSREDGGATLTLIRLTPVADPAASP